MRFGTCPACKKYKFLTKSSQCVDCSYDFEIDQISADICTQDTIDFNQLKFSGLLSELTESKIIYQGESIRINLNDSENENFIIYKHDNPVVKGRSKDQLTQRYKQIRNVLGLDYTTTSLQRRNIMASCSYNIPTKSRSEVISAIKSKSSQLSQSKRPLFHCKQNSDEKILINKGKFTLYGFSSEDKIKRVAGKTFKLLYNADVFER